MKKTPEDIIILHFTVYHEWQSYDVWFLRYGAQQAKSFLILDHLLKNQNFDHLLKNQNQKTVCPFTKKSKF